MAEYDSFSDADDYIREVDKFPEKIDFARSLQCVEYYHKTLFEVTWFYFVCIPLLTIYIQQCLLLQGILTTAKSRGVIV